jgi:hypothetical protein
MVHRRDVVGAIGLAGLAEIVSSADIAAAAGGSGSALPAGAKVPAFALLYECTVTISPAIDFGPTIEGRRRVIPITGGTFRGPKMRGTVLDEGADWNLSRKDGAGSADAAYYLRTDDQVLIRIVNQGVGVPPAAADPAAAERFLMYTHATFEAPTGRYDWLNRGTFFGTLSIRRGVSDAVLIRMFQLV